MISHGDKRRGTDTVSNFILTVFSPFFRNITFAFQMPLPRGGVQLDYSRWMANMLTLVIPEVLYDTRISNGKSGGGGKESLINGEQFINATVVLKVRLGVKNAGETTWREYYKKDALRRTITCRIEASKVRKGEEAF